MVYKWLTRAHIMCTGIIMYNYISNKLYITQKTWRKTNFHNAAWQRVHNNRTQPTHRNIAPCLVLLPTLVGTEPVSHLVPHGIADGSPFSSSPNVREGAELEVETRFLQMLHTEQHTPRPRVITSLEVVHYSQPRLR